MTQGCVGHGRRPVGVVGASRDRCGGRGRAGRGATAGVAGAAPRFEDKRRAPRGRGAADEAVVKHEEAAIQQLAHLDADASVGAGAAQLDPARPHARSVVAGDHAAIAAAQDLGEIAWGAPPDRVRRGGGLPEAAIAVGDECGHVGVRGLDGGDPAQAEFTDETVLQGASQAFALKAALEPRSCVTAFVLTSIFPPH